MHSRFFSGNFYSAGQYKSSTQGILKVPSYAYISEPGHIKVATHVYFSQPGLRKVTQLQNRYLSFRSCYSQSPFFSSFVSSRLLSLYQRSVPQLTSRGRVRKTLNLLSSSFVSSLSLLEKYSSVHQNRQVDVIDLCVNLTKGSYSPNSSHHPFLLK